MAQTTVTAEQLEKSASVFEASNNALQSTLTGLLGELSGLQTAWRGAGGMAFGEVKRQYEADQKVINDELLKTAEAVRTSGKSYTTSDTEAASRVAKSNSGLQLPL